MAFHQFTPADGSEPFGSFEVFEYYDSFGEHPGRIGERGWYWHACQPGCMPDGDLSGPFETEAEAIADANS